MSQITARRWQYAAALALLALAAALLWLRLGGNRSAVENAISRRDPGHAPTRLAALDSSFRALEDGDSLSPRDYWDPEYVVAMVGREPERIYDWVAANTDWVP